MTKRRMRSSLWLEGDDEVALNHRVAIRTGAPQIAEIENRPVIGIADTSSDLNPCNLPLAALIPHIAAGIESAGGIPMRFPVMSLGEDLMKPSALLYRNLVSMEIEEMIRSNPLDGVVLLANCDKTGPALLMGAASADIPAILVFGGARPPAIFRNKSLSTGTDLWRLLEDYRAGKLSQDDWKDVERCMACGIGSCNAMGTASTMAIVTEVLGMCLPGTSTIPAGSPEAPEAARQSGVRIVGMVHEDFKPSEIMDGAAFSNARIVLNAIAGSTNAIVHLPAIAGRLGISWPLAAWAEAGYEVPVIADVEPSGQFRIQQFHDAGGVPVLLRQIRHHLDCDTVGVGGRLSETLSAQPNPGAGEAIRMYEDPIAEGPAFAVVFGSLAPDGAVIKVSAASPELLCHKGPAVVFRGYEDMRARLDDPGLAVTRDSILVLAGCGPVNVPGMPEWGMMPIPQRLVSEGVRDMVRVSDGRMSGTSFGTVVLHVAPEAGMGGPLALVEDGDIISLDAHNGRLDLLVDDAELSRRREALIPPIREHLRGWPLLFQRHVTQAPLGCDLDFLIGETEAQRQRIEPVIGRS